MPNTSGNKTHNSVRHRDRLTQVPIYFGKLVRSFIYQSDWKVLPMSAVIAALVSMVIRRNFAVTMEGTLIGAFAVTCVAIWNGSFNSIQSICRERSIVKREHRSGMHITAYVFSQMIYQALLCAAQSGITLYVLKLMKVHFPAIGLFTGYAMVDMGITIFLVSYSSDMIALFISSIAHTTTGAMTVVPFLLIFQLVFAGGIFKLPEWAEPIQKYTISGYGMKCLAAQANYNDMPLATAWDTLVKLEDREVDKVVTLDEVLTIFEKKDNPTIAEFRSRKLKDFIESMQNSADSSAESVVESVSESAVESVREMVTEEMAAVSKAENAESTVISAEALEQTLAEVPAVKEYANTIGNVAAEQAVMALTNKDIESVTIGDLIDLIGQGDRSVSFPIHTTVKDLIDIVGEDKVKVLVREETALASRIPAYNNDRTTIMDYWVSLFLFVLLFALLTTISLEFIDKDKR